MPFDPDLRQHKIETAEYRVDGDYSHAIPAHPEYNSATEFNNAFYQERRDENDTLVGLPVAPIVYTNAPPPAPPVEIPDPGLKFQIVPYAGGGGALGIGKLDISIDTVGKDLDGNDITHHPSIPGGFSSTVNGQLILVYYDINDILKSASFDITTRFEAESGLSFYNFASSSKPDQEFLDSIKFGSDCWIDSSYP